MIKKIYSNWWRTRNNVERLMSWVRSSYFMWWSLGWSWLTVMYQMYAVWLTQPCNYSLHIPLFSYLACVLARTGARWGCRAARRGSGWVCVLSSWAAVLEGTHSGRAGGKHRSEVAEAEPGFSPAVQGDRRRGVTTYTRAGEIKAR